MLKKISSLTFLLLLGILQNACDNSSYSKDKILNIGADADPAIVASLPFQQRSFQMGTAGYVPNNYPDSSNADWESFFNRDAAEYGGLFGVHLSPASEKDQHDLLVQVRIAYQNMDHVIPYVALRVSHSSGAFTHEKGEELVRVAKANAHQYKPKYFSVGVEINTFKFFQGSNYPLLLEYTLKALDEIKVVSPNTIRMTNFQLDRMKGKAALTGIYSSTPNWQLIDDFDGRIEAVSFTAYPFLHYKNVEDIPDNYLSEIRTYTDLPILITETGWPTVDLASGVVGSDQNQIDYMVKIAKQATDEDVQAIVWLLPRDAQIGSAVGIFDNISLFTNKGEPKPAYEYWKAINAVPLPK